MRRREFIAGLFGATAPALWFTGAHAQRRDSREITRYRRGRAGISRCKARY